MNKGVADSCSVMYSHGKEDDMSFIAYVKNKKTGAVYAYRQEAYRDPETKRPKSRRTYLGRVDPDSGEILEKGSGGVRGRKAREREGAAGSTPAASCGDIGILKGTINSQQKQIEELSSRIAGIEERLRAIADFLSSQPAGQ